MALDARRVRLWFGGAALLLVVLVAGFFLYARYRVRKVMDQVKQVETTLGVDVQQSANRFHACKSEGPRTLFCVDASKWMQFKQNGRSELQEVMITVYGRKGTRYDQISGERFAYDPQSGVVSALGPVQIDLEGGNDGQPGTDQAPPPEMKNPVHLKTSGLTFDQKTGMAHTDERIEFRTRQASGSAMGASYDSKANQLTLESQVVIHSSGTTSGDVMAAHAIITKEPLVATLEKVQGQGNGQFAADRVQIYFRLDSTVERAVATGNVHAWRQGDTGPAAGSPKARPPADFHAERAEVFVTEDNTLHSAVLSGNVMFDVGGARSLYGQSQRLLIDFGPKSRVTHFRALENVALTQQPGQDAPNPHPPASGASRAQVDSVQSVQFTVADGLEGEVKNNRIQRAWTTGPGQILLTQAPSAGSKAAGKTTITATRFDAAFDGRNHLQSLHGEPDARIVSTTPGQPDRVTTSRNVDIALNATGNGVSSITQDGNFQYTEGTRRATADRARYAVADETFVLSGNPRYSDTGVSLTADSLRMNRKTGDANAEGDVKATYAELKPQPQGAMLAGGNPVHVTAGAMVAHRVGSGAATNATARFTGGARLWQDSGIVEAPEIQFDRERRSLLAQGNAQHPVSTVFVQQEKDRTTPVNVTSNQLSYVDADRRARFTGGVTVTVRAQETTLTGEHADVILQPRSEGTASNPVQTGAGGPSRVQQIVVESRIGIDQKGRKASGEKLVYTPSDGKFVLTGGPPSIFDAEHGKITGDTLTFFSHDDRVLVEGSSTGRGLPTPRSN